MANLKFHIKQRNDDFPSSLLNTFTSPIKSSLDALAFVGDKTAKHKTARQNANIYQLVFHFVSSPFFTLLPVKNKEWIAAVGQVAREPIGPSSVHRNEPIAYPTNCTAPHAHQ